MATSEFDVDGVNGVNGVNSVNGVNGVDSSGTRHVDATPASSAMADMRRAVAQRSACVQRQRGVAIPGVAGRA